MCYRHRSLARTRHRSVWGYSHYWLVWTLHRIESVTRLGFLCKILSLWTISLFFLPIVISSYIGIFLFRLAIRTLFSHFYPHLRIVDRFSLRTLLHTRVKPADVVFALRFIGCPNIKWIRHNLSESLLNKRDTNGSLAFPELRSILTTKWAVPVWTTDPDFSVERHVFYKTDNAAFNIEAFVTKMGGQFLPPNRPPWRMFIIADNNRETKRFYAILWLHNSLSSILTLEDLIQANGTSNWTKTDRRNTSFNNPLSSTELLVDRLLSGSLVKVNGLLSTAKNTMNTPQHTESCLGYVTSFVMKVLDDIKACCNQKSSDKVLKIDVNKISVEVILKLPVVILFSMYCHKALLISAFGVSTTLLRKFSALNTISYCLWLCRRACISAITLSLRILYLIISRNPRSFLNALRSTLLYQAIAEILSIVWTIFLTPYLIFQELSHQCQLNGLQKNALSGRRLAFSSQKMSMETLDNIRRRSEASVSHVLLGAITLSLQKYFRDSGEYIPDNLFCSLPIYRNILTKIHEGQPSGFLTIALPTGLQNSNIIVKKIKSRLEKIKGYRFKFLLTMWLYENITTFCPTLVVRFFLQWFTRKYPVLIANMFGPKEPVSVWGYVCDEMNYWTPTLGDRKMSLTAISYCGKLHVNTLIDENFVSQADAVRDGVIRNVWNIATDLGIKIEGNSPHSSARNTPQRSPGETPSCSPTLNRKIILL